jgi:hypothetical protein
MTCPRNQGIASVLFALGLAPIALSQGTDPRPDEPRQGEAAPPELAGADPREEMMRLFGEVERNLETIDRELVLASSGETSVQEVRSSGIEDLLRSTGTKSESVVTDISKILELARSMDPKGGGT